MVTALGVVSAGAFVPVTASAALACEPGQVVTEVPWAQRLLAPERVWPHATGAGTTVAVIDSAVDSSHRQLRGRTDPLMDYLEPASPTSCVPHGTGVASIIAAQQVSGVGFRGLAPGARILPVRVSDRIDGTGDTVDPATFARAIRDTTAKGVDVMNISLVFTRDDPLIRDAIAQAIAANVVIVAAAGNGHTDNDPLSTDPAVYPAAYPGVLGVGAITETGEKLAQSNVGSYVDVVAPGADVLVATPVQGHTTQSGTSFAAPFVAATAALVREERPEATASQVVSRIIATANPARGGPGYGRGIVDPYRAVTEPLVGEDPEALPPAPAPVVDPAAEAREARWRELGGISLALFGIGLGLVIALVVGTRVYRRGSTRRWQASRAPRTP
jgi:type VII secretion-associated serine protease mycosin